MNAQRLFHITTRAALEAARVTATVVPDGFAAEGFVHCSYDHQITRVANARFRGRTDLVLLEFDRARLALPVIDENLEGGSELFPHVYGPLPLTALIRAHDFPSREDGGFDLPPAVEAGRRSVVVFIHGPPAAGKHTVGSAVAERLGIPLFHNHLTVDLVATLFEFGSPAFRRLRAGIWRVAFETCARERTSFVFTFNPEATVAAQDIDDLVSVIRDAGGRLYFVELACSRDTVIERLQNDSRKRFGKLTDPHLFDQIDAQGGFDFDGDLPTDLRVDSDALTPDQAAALVVESLRRMGATGAGS